MKSPSAFAALAWLAAFVPAAAQSLPAGTYAISGTVKAITGTVCPAPLKYPVTGVLVYPAEKALPELQMTLQSVTPQKKVTSAYFFAFPPVPSGGLDGWTSKNPVSPNYTQYDNGRLTGGGTSAVLSFNLSKLFDGPLSAAQGTMTMNVDSIGLCTETFLLTFQRIPA
jgi:hypothetical protein